MPLNRSILPSLSSLSPYLEVKHTCTICSRHSAYSDGEDAPSCGLLLFDGVFAVGGKPRYIAYRVCERNCERHPVEGCGYISLEEYR